MPFELIPFGEPYRDLSPGNLTLDVAKSTLSICRASQDFEVLELRRLKIPDGGVADIIVLDCVNDQIGSQNLLGIKVRERLALVFSPDKMPEVRALRKDFPVNILHFTQGEPGQPPSLCLYAEPWTAVERTWTPQKFLKLILWWLTGTAKGTLHQPNQPLEPMYYPESPFEIVLPPDFQEKIKDKSLSLTLAPVERSDGNFKILRGLFISKNTAQTEKIPHIEQLMIELPAAVHSGPEHHPNTLGLAHDQFARRGSPFLKFLNDAIREKAEGGLTRDPLGRCLLILNTPLKRTVDSEPERHEIRAFLLLKDLATLGEVVGALTELKLSNGSSKLYRVQLVGGSKLEAPTIWRELAVFPVDIKTLVDKDFARKASGVRKDSADFKGVLAGAGALGGGLAELWAKGAWGNWTFIDADILKAHNVVRHIGKDPGIGLFKVDVVTHMLQLIYDNGYYTASAIPDSIKNWNNTGVKEAVTAATLFVDATTTLEVPRDLCQREDVPRSVSVFLTPSGNGSVILLEDSDRTLRLDSLEAQYYRAILNRAWGEGHLAGHLGHLSVGAGCRDISAIIPNDLIQLHSAILARQVRLNSDCPTALIQVWHSDPNTGSIITEVITPEQPRVEKLDLKIVWDEGLRAKIHEMRADRLPSETGGILLGYFDLKLHHVYVVDALPAPGDSKGDSSGFTRGIEGLQEAVQKAEERTARIVSYIGEWHTHPQNASARPSMADFYLLAHLAKILQRDGLPAIMFIIGEQEEQWLVGKS